MKKMIACAVVMILVCFVCTWGQARRVVLLEEATNASCPPCAANNPKLQEFFSRYFGGVVSVRYHAWWPGRDPMYDENPSNNEKRITYYGITGVPHYLMNGIDYGVPSDPVGMVMNLTKLLSQPAPVKIIIDADITSDSVKATLSLLCLEAVRQRLYLRAAVIERMVTYATPPGSNGEKVFPDVMRKLLPNSRGFSITSIDPGDTLRYEIDDPVQPHWNWRDLAVVAWLQSDETKEVVQSNISLPTYAIESSEPSADVLDPNRTYTKYYWIENDHRDTLHLRILTDAVHVPLEWSFHLLFDSQPLDSFDLVIAPDDSVGFMLHIETGSNADWLKVRLFAKNMDDPYGYGFTQNYVGLIPQGDILFVDDDGQEEFESTYVSAFEAIGAPFTTIPEPDLHAVLHQLDMNQFQAVFWNVSRGFPAFVPDDITVLKSYLDQGGNVFLAGQDIAWDIFSSSGYSHFPEARDFYLTYLDAAYHDDDAEGDHLEGSTGDPISDDLSIQLNAIYTLSPDWIGSQTGVSVPIFRHVGTNRVGGLRYDSGLYRVVYLAFGLEQITDPSTAHRIIERTLDWFDEKTAVGIESERAPCRFQLFQNFPNPFNPHTDIRYRIGKSGFPINTTLNIYNILGQHVRTLVNEVQEEGSYRVWWDGKDSRGQQVAAGMYVYRLTAGNFKASRCMVLLR
jgi:hypothetical protein